MRFLLYPAAATLDAPLLIHFQLNDRLAAERLLIPLGRTVPQVLIVPLGAWRIHHEAGAVLIIV